MCKENRVEEATKLALGLYEKDFDHDVCTFNSLIDGLCMSGNHRNAMELFRDMKNKGCPPMNIVQVMTSNGCEPDAVTYGTIISGLCKAGRVEIASRLLRTIQFKGFVPAPQAYNPIIQALYRKRGLKKACVFSEKWRVVILHNGERLHTEFSSFSMLAEGLCALSMEDESINLIDLVMNKENFSESEISMVMGFLKIRKYQDALANFDHILSILQPRRSYRR
ncbi:hypothetical protein MKW92_037527 [Papaver armeniacum]|nr:hypothetical protein MKW92_037527 [Papaver armeniacum]